MLETDPIGQAQHNLLGAVQAVLRGGDPNLMRAPCAALLKAKGQGKIAREIEALAHLPFVKPKR